MKTKQLFIVVLTIVLAVAAVIVTRQIHATSNLQSQSPQAQTKEDAIPDHIFYGETLSLLAKLKDVNDYQDRAQLTDEQANFLRVTAEECAEKLAKQDAIAEKRIVALRRQNLKAKPAQSTPPIPAEIAELQAQRNAVILRCRDSLRAGLGHEKFEQFRLAAKSKVHIQMSRVR